MIVRVELFKLFGTILVDNDKANKSIAKTDQQAESSGKKISSSFKKIGVAVGTFLSVKAIKDFGGACIEAYKVQAEAEKKLEVVMKQRFNATDKSIQSVKDYTSAQQKLGVVGDEVQMAGAQQLSTFLTTDKSLKKLIPAMNNLAVQQNGVNVSSGKMVNIGNLMGKVMQGQTSALTRVGITFDAAQEKVLKYGTETERASMLAEVITQNVGNMNEELAKTDAGKIQQAKNNFGDLQELIGSYLTPVVANLYSIFDVMTVFLLNNLSPAISTIGSFLSGLMGNFNLNMSSMSQIWNTYGRPIWEGFLVLLESLKKSWFIIFPSIQALWTNFWGLIQASYNSIGKPLFDTIKFVVSSLIDFFVKNMPAMSKIASEVFTNISKYWNQVLKPVINAIGALLKNLLLPTFKSVFSAALRSVQNCFNMISFVWENVLKPILNGIIDFIGGVFQGNWSQTWNGIVSIVSGLWSGIKTILWSPIEWLIDKLSGITDFITSPFQDAADAIENIWEAIKSVFKLPHFTFDGSWNPLDWLDDGLPEIGVEWYAKGGILTQPTIFGMSPNGDFRVGGEAGDEAVAPISVLEDYFKKWSKEGDGDLVAIMTQIRDYLTDDERWYKIFLRALSDGSFAVVLNGREIGRLKKSL